MPLILANNGRRLIIGNIASLGDYVESLPGVLNINRLYLSHLELSPLRFNVEKVPPW